MRGERVGAVAVHDVGLRRRVVPIEVVGADDKVGAAKRFRFREIGGLQPNVRAEGRRNIALRKAAEAVPTASASANTANAFMERLLPRVLNLSFTVSSSASMH